MRGHEVGDRHGVVVQSRGDQAGIVGHIDHQLRADALGDLGKRGVGNLAGIGAGPGHDQLRLVLLGQGGKLVDIDAVRILSDAVAIELVKLAGGVELHAVGQVPAVGQVEAQHDIARVEDRKIHGRIGLGPGVRLDVGVVGPEEFLGPIAGEVFGHVDEFAPAIVAAAGVAFGVFIGQHAAHALHDGGAGVVLAGDHFQAVALALDFAGDGCPDVRVVLFDRVHEDLSV